MYELVDTYEADSPIKVTGRKITHMDSTVEPGDKAIDNEVNPSFGGSFAVPGFTVDSKGHLSNVALNMINIPDDTATTNAAGLMSANDVIRLDYLAKHSIQKKTATDIVQVLVTTPDNELVIADVTTDGSGSNVSVVIAQPYSANLTVTIWYIVTE